MTKEKEQFLGVARDKLVRIRKGAPSPELVEGQGCLWLQ